MKKSSHRIHNAYERLPTDPKSRAILKERATTFAHYMPNLVCETELHRYVAFHIGNESYGLLYENIKEVIPKEDITPIPCVPSYVAGMINYRGTLLTVLNLKQYFHMDNTMESPYILVAADKTVQLGLLVDTMDGSHLYDADQLQEPLTSERIPQKQFILGIHKGKTALLCFHAMLSEIEHSLANTK